MRVCCDAALIFTHILSLQWFEAAAFFDYAARIDDPRNAEQWRALYSARITCYEASLKDFETSVAALREHAVHRGLI